MNNRDFNIYSNNCDHIILAKLSPNIVVYTVTLYTTNLQTHDTDCPSILH